MLNSMDLMDAYEALPCGDHRMNSVFNDMFKVEIATTQKNGDEIEYYVYLHDVDRPNICFYEEKRKRNMILFKY